MYDKVEFISLSQKYISINKKEVEQCKPCDVVVDLKRDGWSLSNQQVTHTLQIFLAKHWFTFQATQDGTAQDFIVLLRLACSLKLRKDVFLNFPFNIVRLWLTMSNQNLRKPNWGSGGYCG